MKSKKMAIAVISVAFAILLSIGLAGCSSKSAPSNEAESNVPSSTTSVPEPAQIQEKTPAPEPKIENNETVVTDMAGDTVTLPGKVEKIACTWPSGTQLFITLGMSDLLTAVPSDSKEQPWAMHMAPSVKNLAECSNDLSAEQFLNLGADIVITTEADVANDLRSKNVTAITLNYYSVDEMRKAITLLASIVPEPHSTSCTNYLAYLDEQINRVQTALEHNVTERASLYYINGNNNKGLYKTAGGNTMNEAWANYAYTDFVTSDILSSSETKVDAEAVLAKNPEYVVIGGRYQRVLYNELMSAEEWKNIDAIKNGHVLTAPLGVSPFDRFGAEFALMIPWLANQVYPDLFAYDAASEIQDFYKSFAGYEMTRQEAEYIVDALMPDGTREIENG